MMTVANLIQELMRHDPDIEVVIYAKDDDISADYEVVDMVRKRDACINSFGNYKRNELAFADSVPVVLLS